MDDADLKRLREDLRPFEHRPVGTLRIDMSDVRVIVSALSRLSAAEARVGVLEMALRPFATAFEKSVETWPGAVRAVQLMRSEVGFPDFEGAAQALTKQGSSPA
jgi:hypothetical protein